MNIEFPKNLNVGLPPEIQGSKNSLFEVFLLIVVCALFTWFIILPKKAEVDAKNEELKKAKTQQESIKGGLETLTSRISELKTHKSDVTNGDTALLADPFGKPRSLQKLNASVFVTGSFSQLEEFLKKVETSGRIMQVHGLENSPGQQGDLGLKISLDSYYFGPTAQ